MHWSSADCLHCNGQSFTCTDNLRHCQSLCRDSGDNLYDRNGHDRLQLGCIFRGTITSGAGTNSITVTWTTAGAQTVSVNYLNSFGCAATVPTIYNVTVNPLPVPTIAGNTSVCAGSTGNVYTTETGMTGYSWSVSAGGIITAGAGTNSITVTWNATGAQTVGINYTNSNGCTGATRLSTM